LTNSAQLLASPPQHSLATLGTPQPKNDWNTSNRSIPRFDRSASPLAYRCILTASTRLDLKPGRCTVQRRVAPPISAHGVWRDHSFFVAKRQARVAARRASAYTWRRAVLHANAGRPSVSIMGETTASWFITVEGKEVERWRMQGWQFHGVLEQLGRKHRLEPVKMESLGRLG